MRRAARRLLALLRLGPRLQLLYAEAFVRLALARVLILFKFAKVAPSLGERWMESDASLAPEQIPVVREIAKAVLVTGRYTPWESKCLVRAIACMKMLARRGIPSTLYLGTGKDEQGRLIAHAWLRSGPYYVSGAEVMDRFVTVDKYAHTAKS
ncbi:lasso peptide biosynthesis B2 protein [Paenibacillus glufosinatiresistens]|uniref:lasso peptide biosynthesis B2 protein n=1 Tax=Paenibacillus glufosinatiresistens TaxID=3070657 RepID=UPI00286E0645|nr:lasso peptide biosynthesis B2 protein [Paenibacillus sp. YX.27]